jgi:uncharacterized membrane protein
MMESVVEQSPPSDRDRLSRIMVIAVHVLFLLSLPLLLVPLAMAIHGITWLPIWLSVVPLALGALFSYFVRKSAPEKWQTHFDQAIQTFWSFIVLMMLGVLFYFAMFIGIVFMFVAYYIVVHRAIVGIGRALKWSGVEH